MDEDIGIGEVIESLIDYSMQDRYTALPAVVLAVHSQGGTQLLDVQPCVSINNRDGSVTDQATVLNVPYQQPASSKGGMVFPILPGDNVLLIYCMRGIDTWKYGQGTPTAPSDYRMFSKMDCIAIPCVAPIIKTPTKGKHTSGYALGDVAVYNAMNGNQCEVILKANGDVIVNSPGTITINCTTSEVNASGSATITTPTLTVDSPSSTFTGAVNVEGHLSYQAGISGKAGGGGGQGNTIQGGFSLEGGSITHDGINIGSNHVHGGVDPGSGTSGGPQ